MKKLISTLVFITIFSSLFAQSNDQANKKLIESFVNSNIDIQLENMDQAAVGKVFSGTFYKTRVNFIVNGHDLSSYESITNVNGNLVNMIDPTYTTLECPVLTSLIKKGFILKDETAAKQFEAALNVLYPFDDDDAEEVKHVQKGNQWIFIRGKFFDDLKAFIVSTEANGTITNVEYNLESSVD